MMRARLRADVDAFLAASAAYHSARPGRIGRLSAMLTPQLLAVQLHRLAHLMWVTQHHHLATFCERLNTYLHKVELPARSCIGAGLHLPHPVSVIYDADAGENLALFAMSASCSATGPTPPASRARADDGVHLGASSLLAAGARAGNGCRIGMLAIARGELPPGTTLISRNARARGATRPTARIAGRAQV